MSVEIGSVLEGKVTGVKKFGAFVALPEGNMGMIHISEVSSQYIENLSDFLSEGQNVKVKVIGVDNGKIALSIKRTEDQPKPVAVKRTKRADPGRVWQPKVVVGAKSEMSFEEMMSQFKTRSEEKISDLRKSTESRRGGSSGYSRKSH